ncbi:P-type conjugative transfer protein TrbG [Nitrosospira sp. NpAV]|uniref:P-type conjugative transfer protein TrbG n=1 Tax=Nitrosospira sp. NpAV TaxID=58133 RepID=UPI0005A0FC8C|nr:P-type conjugative transfer protein TrbG [Nitrosospira sp. NpAV]KIO48705.1 conjugal transfer protein TrbG [Nitrosospira sp. NpAV]
MRTYWIIPLAFVVPAVDAQMVPHMVPPIERTALAVPAIEAAPAQIQLNDKEQRALAIVREWRNNPDKPRRSADGTVMYLYGATLPTLICTPLHTCAIKLQPGEVVNDVHAGDAARWRITPSMIGSGSSAITNVIVKPTDSGLTTNLIITTDRRSYTILLKSARIEWMPSIAFDYPDEQERTWANYKANQGRVVNASTLTTGENTAALDFNFRLGGDNPKWKPQRVYTDGTKTYIQFPSANFADEAPALVSLGKGASLWSGPAPQLVNYRLIGDRYVVDKVLRNAALISGVGNAQVKVTIDYLDGGQSR